MTSAKRTIAKISAILASERDALSHSLIYQIGTTFRQPVHISFARTKIAAFNSVIEHAENGVTVILIVLAGVHAALCGDRVATSGAILKTKASYLITHPPYRPSHPPS